MRTGGGVSYERRRVEAAEAARPFPTAAEQVIHLSRGSQKKKNAESHEGESVGGSEGVGGRGEWKARRLKNEGWKKDTLTLKRANLKALR